MTAPKEPIFALVLASAVHDMKNSLGMLMGAISLLNNKYPVKDEDDKQQLSVFQYEATRLNSALVQLLGLYKIEKQQLTLNYQHHNLEDFVTDSVLQHAPLLEHSHITANIDVDDELDGFFDGELISSVLSNVIGNSIRYTKTQLLISAFYDNGIMIQVADDGPGYPKSMLDKHYDFSSCINAKTGSTGLGLYFAAEIAKLHIHDGQTGSIKIFNGAPLNGGVFQIKIP
ncbi:sensor histidine kinase KdpD [Pleionea sp. CnH1-48]|uniref:sensor histidine kinase n=1 Tax=Pleionea sp. CnH1-48 TaxID=2954494 RepID=UPI00209826FC|nr:HAMP domain-containing sensor histidine kinase [Pleionea sp. CnH1-48]MCO7223602.1 HAMP domain-containing histidine kinase [Pleionea sp. CnH1-48]